LTGLVLGSSAAASLGTVLVACSDRTWLRAGVFAAVVGSTLLCRARTHVEPIRRVALITGGLLALTAGFAATVTGAPGYAPWVSVLVMGAGIGTLGCAFGQPPISPVVRRAVDVIEYAALAAVVPLACWVGDLYAMVRAASLA
jgi:type VII secretion integral membrane protein EccD